MFLKQNDKTAISFTGFTDSTSKSTKNVHEVLGHHAPFHSESCGGHWQFGMVLHTVWIYLQLSFSPNTFCCQVRTI